MIVHFRQHEKSTEELDIIDDCCPPTPPSNANKRRSLQLPKIVKKIKKEDTVKNNKLDSNKEEGCFILIE